MDYISTCNKFITLLYSTLLSSRIFSERGCDSDFVSIPEVGCVFFSELKKSFHDSQAACPSESSLYVPASLQELEELRVFMVSVVGKIFGVWTEFISKVNALKGFAELWRILNYTSIIYILRLW